MARLPGDFDVRIVAADALSAAETQAWRDIQAEESAFANPLFGPEFAAAVARVRSDAKVAVYRRAGRIEAFLAFHRRPSGFGRPIGAPFCDYHGLVARRGEGPGGPEAMSLAGLSAFRHSGLVDPGGVFPGLDAGPQSFAIELHGSPDDHLEAARAASPKKFKNWRRLRHRLEEDFGPLVLAASRDAEDFERVMDWKRDQFARTGVQDVLKPDWVDALMHDLFASDLGLMLTLHAGDTLVGGHFGIRSDAIYHPWIASTSPELAHLSPGQTFLDQAVRAMPGLGLTVYDLGPGHDHYKRPFTSVERGLQVGLTSTLDVRGQVIRAVDRSWMIGGVGRRPVVDKIRRRLDHIAASDPSLKGRVQGIVAAALATRRRSLAGEGAAAD